MFADLQREIEAETDAETVFHRIGELARMAAAARERPMGVELVALVNALTPHLEALTRRDIARADAAREQPKAKQSSALPAPAMRAITMKRSK